MKTNDEKILSLLLSGKAPKKYEGKQVVVCNGEVYILPRNDKKAGEFFHNLLLEHPRSTPTITFVPKRGIYILSLHK